MENYGVRRTFSGLVFINAIAFYLLGVFRTNIFVYTSSFAVSWWTGGAISTLAGATIANIYGKGVAEDLMAVFQCVKPAGAIVSFILDRVLMEYIGFSMIPYCLAPFTMFLL